MATNYERIKAMSVEEMAEFLQKTFDENKENFGCYGCMHYETHHYPDDCKTRENGKPCYWLSIEGNIKKWLKSEADNDR